MPAALLRVRSPNLNCGAKRYTPSPLLRRRCPVLRLCRWRRSGCVSCLGCSPSPCVRDCAACAGLLRRAVGLSRGCCAAAAPSCAAPSRGRGFPAWVRSACNRGLSLARTMRPQSNFACGCAVLPCCRLGAKVRPRGLFVAACRCALLRLGASRPAPVLPAAVLPAAACSRFAVCSPRRKTISKAYQKHIKVR